METVNQEKATAAEPEKTFTQSELEAIIGERLNRERAKYADYEDIKAKAVKYDEAEEASKSELQKATERAEALQAQLDKMVKADSVRQVREKVSAELKVPATLLTGETEEACIEQAKQILEFAKPSGYPAVSDKGEVIRHGGGATRDQFADWFGEKIK